MSKPLQAAAKKQPLRKKTPAPAAAPAPKQSVSHAVSRAAPAPPPAPLPAPPATGRRIQVRKSGVHGKGVFALQPIKRGAHIIEYVGEIITWPQALERHPHNPAEPNHTFYFHVDEQRVIDANVGGNAARWINHACRPNCKADQQDDGRVFIRALKNLKAGDELFYDYGLVIDERYTPKLKKEYECRCGHFGCRGTMLAPKR